MRIDRTLSFYTSQSVEPPRTRELTGLLHDEVPHLRMGRTPGEDGITLSIDSPALIILRCRLVPHFVTERPTATFANNGRAMVAAPLYLTDRPPIHSVNVVFEGDGSSMENTLSGGTMKPFQGMILGAVRLALTSPLLYKRTFECTKTNLTVTQTIVKSQTIIDPPGTANVQPFFAYGGALHSGIRLGDIQQYYAMVSSNSTHTLITPHSARTLMERGLRLEFATPQKLKGVSGDVQLMSTLTEGRSYSLYDDIVKGAIPVTLVTRGSDDPKAAVNYISFQAEQLGLSPSINLSFKRSLSQL